MEKIITFTGAEPEPTKEQERYSIMLSVMENCLILKNVLAVEVKNDSEMEEPQSKDITTTITSPSMCDGFAKNATMNGTNTMNQSDLQESRNSPRMSISSSAGSLEHARILALQDLEKAWQESEVDCFSRSCAWPKKSSPSSYSLKMFRPLLPEEDSQSPSKLPKWGMIVDGVLYPLQALELYIVAIDGSYWLTPTTMDHLPIRTGEALERSQYRGKSTSKRKTAGRLNEQLAYLHMWPTPRASDHKRGDSPCERKRNSPTLSATLNMELGTKNQKVNLNWLEWLMGYKIGHTELKPWAMQWFQLKPEKRLCC